MNKRRQRKSNKEHFASDAEYKEFARKRNEATRKCRQKMAHERKFYQEAFLRAKEELDLLRQGGAADLYWRDRVEELQSRLKERDDELAEKISRIAFLEREQREYREAAANLLGAAVTTLHYPAADGDGRNAVPEAVATVIVDVGDIFEKEVLDGGVGDQRHLDFNSL